MSDPNKMNLEEVKKNFPSLGDFSKEKLLGGGVPIDGDYWDANWNVGPYGDSLTYSEFQQEMGHPGFSGGSGQGGLTGGGGYAYFGDTDDWDDSYGDMGGDSWGDGSWDAGGSGGYEPDYDGNPGGTQGGSMTWPPFSQLWLCYPHNNINGEPQHPSSDPWVSNQCAVRVGYTFLQAGIDLSSYTQLLTSEGYPRWARGLALWVSQHFGPPIILSEAEFQNTYWNCTGLIFLDLPGNTDHIDLFNAGETGSGYYTPTEVWFWPID